MRYTPPRSANSRKAGFTAGTHRNGNLRPLLGRMLCYNCLGKLFGSITKADRIHRVWSSRSSPVIRAHEHPKTHPRMLNTAAPFVRVPKWKEPGRPQQKNDGIYTIEYSSPPCLPCCFLSSQLPTVNHSLERVKEKFQKRIIPRS